jgi:alpha-beta hydrolase superfamily lysophospholipase
LPRGKVCLSMMVRQCEDMNRKLDLLLAHVHQRTRAMAMLVLLAASSGAVVAAAVVKQLQYKEAQKAVVGLRTATEVLCAQYAVRSPLKKSSANFTDQVVRRESSPCDAR